MRLRGREHAAAGAPVLPPRLQRAVAQDVYNASAARQTGEYYPMWAGPSGGPRRDLPGATEVVQTIVREARAVIDRLPR